MSDALVRTALELSLKALNTAPCFRVAGTTSYAIATKVEDALKSLNPVEATHAHREIDASQER